MTREMDYYYSNLQPVELDYYLSSDVCKLLHGIPLPEPKAPVKRKPHHYDSHLRIPVPEVPGNISYWSDRMPSEQPNAGNDTFSVHTLQPAHQQCDLHVTQSDNRRHTFSRIDVEMANYLHGRH